MILIHTAIQHFFAVVFLIHIRFMEPPWNGRLFQDPARPGVCSWTATAAMEHGADSELARSDFGSDIPT